MLRLMLAGVILAILAACAMPVMQQSQTHVRPEAVPAAGAIPNPVPMTATLPKPRPVQKPETYSVVVDNVRVHDLLFALARDARLNVDISPGISGSVTLNAVDQTLPQLLSRIARQVDMRWELDGPNLAVMPDTPYLRLYRIDYLNMDRITTSTVGVSSQITAGTAAAGGGVAGTVAGNTSSTQLRITSENRFWDNLVKNIEEILRETDKVIPTGAQAGQPVPPAPASAAQISAQAAAAPGAPPVPTQVTAAPATTYREAASVIANKEAGIISIRATSRQHEKIQEFLDQVMASVKRQVLIEATIVEVQLNNQYQQGIDWSLLRSGRLGLNLTQTSAGSPAAINTNMFTGTIADQTNRWNFSTAVKLLESFGNVRVLSSPKLSVLNNQTAILKVVDEVVYFTVQSTASAVPNAGSVSSLTTTPQTTPIGFVMNVTPQIGDGDAVMLNVRPSLTRILGFVNDPNPLLQIANRIPQVQRREMESLIKVNSGQIAVMGGLIQDTLNDVQDGIPGLDRTPAGSLLSQKNVANTKSELVVFLRPLVIRDPSVDGDYRAFRPFVPEDGFMQQPNPGQVSAGVPR